jgi:peroxiredoxin
MALAPGTKAPDFTLKQKTANGLADVTLSANYGERATVLLFFPLAFTSVCTDEMCSVSQGISEYEALNAAVYALSVDSPFAQEAWAKASGITIPVLSDFNKSVAAAYDVLYPDLLGFQGVAKRSTPFSPPSGPAQTLFQWLPAKSKFLAAQPATLEPHPARTQSLSCHRCAHPGNAGEELKEPGAPGNVASAPRERLPPA